MNSKNGRQEAPGGNDFRERLDADFLRESGERSRQVLCFSTHNRIVFMVRKKLLLGLDVREVSLDGGGDELFERNASRLGDAHELRPLFGFEV